MATKKKPGPPRDPRVSETDTTSGDMPPVEEMRQPAEPCHASGGSSRVLHVNGQPIPVHFAHAIAYELTDEGIEEKNRHRDEPSGVQVTGDAWDKTLARGADDATSREVWEDINPLNAAVNRATGGKQDGWAYKLLSSRVIDKKGMRRYEIAHDAQGKEIRVGNMVLGRMPEELRDRRNRHYQQLGNEMLGQVEQAYVADQASNIRAAGREGVSTLRGGEELHDHRDPERSASIGVRIQHGLKGQTAA